MGVEAVFNIAAVLLLFATLIVAAVTDLLHHKVYNWNTFPAIAFGLTLGYAAGGLGSVTFSDLPGSAGFLDHLAGLAVGFTVFYVVYLGTGRGVGLGDVKLIAAIGAIMGLHFIVGAMFWSALVGALMGLWVLIWRGSLLKGLGASFRYLLSARANPDPETRDADLAKLRIPYGVAISFGTILAWFLMELPQA